MPGMGGMGFGGMGAMSGMIAMQGEIPLPDYMLLNSAIKQIVGPAAGPTPAMVAVALRQGGPPTSPFKMMEYIPHLMILAQQHDVKLPGVKGRPTPQKLQKYIMGRSNQWMQANLGYQAMNIDPTLGMMANPVVNSIAPAPAATAVAPASWASPANCPGGPLCCPNGYVWNGGHGEYDEFNDIRRVWGAHV